MANGEGAPEEEDASATLSHDQFDQRSNDGGSPSSSKYSSCGESEFERYCSANSALGTPSVSSSFGPLNGSWESDLFIGLDGTSGNFDLGGRGFGNFGELKLSYLQGDIGSTNRGLLGLNENESDAREEGSVSPRIAGEVGEQGGIFSGLDIDGKEEDGVSSRYRCSGDEDDDDSMYGGGLGDGNLYLHSGVECSEGEGGENANPLLMSSSVAFGSDDWDDFEQERGRGGLVSLTLDGAEEQKEGSLDLERDGFGHTKVDLSGVPAFGLMEIREAVGEGVAGDRQVVVIDCGLKNLEEHTVLPVKLQGSEVEQLEEVRDIPVASCQVQDSHELDKDNQDCSISMFDFLGTCKLEQDNVRDISLSCNHVPVASYTVEKCKSHTAGDLYEMEQDPLLAKIPLELGLGIKSHCLEREPPYVKSEETICVDKSGFIKNQETRDLEVQVDLLSYTTNQLIPQPMAELHQDHKPNAALPVLQNSPSTIAKKGSVSENQLADNCELVKADSLEVNDLYDEIVNEMEEILLDSGESLGARFPQGVCTFQSHQSLPLRDGGSTASTSGTEDGFSLITQALRIDGVEVIGAKQKKGDVSLSERMVGVKEHTVYIIRVWSGQDQWEVERRYRDFYTLYRRLKSFFAGHGWTLPSPWHAIEKESRKIFGSSSPDVVSERSVLIQECLCSIIHSGFFSSSMTAIVWFLCPQGLFPSSPAMKTQGTGSVFSESVVDAENVSSLGKTISLIVEIQPYKSTKQMLEAQHYTCAGCHKHFDDGMTMMLDFVQTSGWGRPRLCEYTGQLFCSSCHTNDTAVLPARVLHHWDFTQYPVSQLAKSYLDSIHKQPMLCVSAVNPFLFAKVPGLHHVSSTRKKIGTLLPYVRCPFRMIINKGLGSRRYLLESNDFFALRDLVDLSKGAFAALPVMLETVSRKIIEHITEQCLICCDVGVPCSAKQACNDPSSLIFPFQDNKVQNCKSCGSVYHKGCFKKLTDCSCGAKLWTDDALGISNKLSRMSSGNSFRRRSSSSSPPAGFLTRLFPKSTRQNVKDHKDSDTIILMGSLPSTTTL